MYQILYSSSGLWTPILIYCCLCSLVLPAQEKDSVLHTYLGAKKQAQEDQREIIAWFGKDNHKDCQKIRDEWLADLSWLGPLSNSYIHAWIDVDLFDGLILKDRFNIEQLPAVLILAPDGTIRARRYDAWNKRAFANWLQQYRMNAKPLAKNAVRDSQGTSSSADADRSASTIVRSHYRVQVGAFSTRKGAELRAEEIQVKTGIETDVQEEIINDRRMFKIYTKKYKRESAAIELKDKLKSYGIDGFVRTLTGSKNI